MHEAGIAASILEIAEREAQGRAIRAIGVRVGELSGVVPDALLFALEALKNSTGAAEATFEVERVPVTAWCDVCGQATQPESDLVLWCSVCGSPLEVRGGQELEFAYLDVDDATDPVVAPQGV